MSATTGIEWTDATWNPTTGCTKVSQGCKNCYAKRDWARLSAMPNNVYTGREFEQVAWHPERLNQPLRWRTPRRVFVNSMSDLFHEDVPDRFISGVFDVMAASPRHTFQILTKRPSRMLSLVQKIAQRHTASDGSGWPLTNVWLGVSVEDQATADERIPLLLQTPAAVRWISAEPLLGPAQIALWLDSLPAIVDQRPRLDWVVAGGESGPNARPMNPGWAHSLRDQCKAAGVRFFFKQWGEWAPADDYPSEIQESYDVRGLTQDKSMRVGKKAAGRMLDGRTWDEYPT